MSSMRNTVQRRPYRERAQPAQRQKWGLLEKPKDYKLRAADHKVKRRKLKTLQQKASERNEDEFYFGMMSAQSQGGVKVAKRGVENAGGGGRVLRPAVVKLMKTQDVGYLRTVLQQTKRERERVEREVVGGNVGVKTDVPSSREGRVVFAEESENHIGPDIPNQNTQMDGWLSEEDENSANEEDLTPEEQRKRHTQAVRRRKLDALKEREHDLATALDEVETQRARMNGSIGGVNKKGVKFKVRQRKR